MTDLYKKIQKFTLRKTAEYYLDRVIKKSLVFQLLILLLPVLFVTVVVAVLVIAVGKVDILQNMWWAFLRILDTGNIAEDKEIKTGFVSLLLTLFGLVVWGTLISIIQNAFQQRMETIKKGRRDVLETGHTVILGWNCTIFNIIIELFLADIKSPPMVVVLADKPRDEIEQQIDDSCLEIWGLMHANDKALRLGKGDKAAFGRFLKHNIVCRSGSIHEHINHKMVNIGAAKSVIILQDEVTERKSMKDARSVKALFMALLQFKNSRPDQVGNSPSIALSVFDHSIKESINLFDKKDVRVHAASVPELISRIIAQTTLQPGLRSVYNDLLDFEGNEFYVVGMFELPESAQGMSFDDLYSSFPQAILVGYLAGTARDGMAVGTLVLNPTGTAASTPLELTDSLILLAEDKSLAKSFEQTVQAAFSSGSRLLQQTACLKKILVIGKGEKPAQIVRYLAEYLHAGSTVYYTGNKIAPDTSTIIHLACDQSLDEQCHVLKEQLTQTSYFDTVVFADDESNADIHDAEMLIKINTAKKFQQSGLKQFSIVTEFLDPRSKPLAELLDVRFAIVTTKFAGNYIVQCVRQPELALIFSELLGSEGNEVCIRNIAEYGIEADGVALTFDSILRTAREHGETAIGYFEEANGDAQPKMVLNPQKSASITNAMRIITIGDYSA